MQDPKCRVCGRTDPPVYNLAPFLVAEAENAVNPCELPLAHRLALLERGQMYDMRRRRPERPRVAWPRPDLCPGCLRHVLLVPPPPAAKVDPRFVLSKRPRVSFDTALGQALKVAPEPDASLYRQPAGDIPAPADPVEVLAERVVNNLREAV
jgi:hypothetical protein